MRSGTHLSLNLKFKIMPIRCWFHVSHPHTHTYPPTHTHVCIMTLFLKKNRVNNGISPGEEILFYFNTGEHGYFYWRNILNVSLDNFTIWYVLHRYYIIHTMHTTLKKWLIFTEHGNPEIYPEKSSGSAWKMWQGNISRIQFINCWLFHRQVTYNNLHEFLNSFDSW